MLTDDVEERAVKWEEAFAVFILILPCEGDAWEANHGAQLRCCSA